MSHTNKASLIKQVTDALSSKLQIGHSRHAAKKAGDADKYIFSWGTFKTYLKHCIMFVRWCKMRHGCKTLSECSLYVNEWLSGRKELSNYTQKLEVAALRKLYGADVEIAFATPDRKRREITRSRGVKQRDRHFSLKKNSDLVDFCRSTGLRRSELEALRGYDLVLKDGVYFVNVRNGKGGKQRYARVIGNVEAVVERMQQAGSAPVFTHIHGAADIHGFRRDYATAYYNMIARPLKGLPEKEVFVCRGDKKGVHYDRLAMLEVSRSLGHNRIDVIAGHYID